MCPQYEIHKGSQSLLACAAQANPKPWMGYRTAASTVHVVTFEQTFRQTNKCKL